MNKKISFDDYAETYEKVIQSSIGFIRQDHDFFIGVKANIIREIVLKNFNREISGKKILDIGSGTGLIDHYLTDDFKEFYGVDVENGIIEKAKKLNPFIKYSLYDGITLPFEDNTMDIVFTINVMHHVKPAYWNNFSKEMFRVVKPGGFALVFEHNPLNPLTRHAVNNCEFDRDAVLIHKNYLSKLFISSGFSNIESSFILFFPFRKMIFRKIENKIKWLPLGAQYYILWRKGK